MAFQRRVRRLIVGVRRDEDIAFVAHPLHLARITLRESAVLQTLKEFPKDFRLPGTSIEFGTWDNRQMIGTWGKLSLFCRSEAGDSEQGEAA